MSGITYPPCPGSETWQPFPLEVLFLLHHIPDLVVDHLPLWYSTVKLRCQFDKNSERTQNQSTAHVLKFM